MEERNLFPAGVRVEIGASPFDTNIFDLESGERVRGIVRITCDISAEKAVPAEIVLTYEPRRIHHFLGAPAYTLTDETMQRLARDNGFALIRTTPDLAGTIVENKGGQPVEEGELGQLHGQPTPDHYEEIGQIADSLDACLYPLKMPGIDQQTAISGMAGSMREARDKLVKIVRDGTGEDPWEFNQLEG